MRGPLELRLPLGEPLCLARTRLPGAALLGLGVALYPVLLPSPATPREAGLVAAGVMVALAMVRGLVSAELRRGTHILWIQKGGRLERRYLARLLWAAILTMLVHVLLLGGVALVSPSLSLPTGPSLVTYLLLDMAVLAVAFAVTAMSLPVEPLTALVLIVGPGLLGADAAVDPKAWGAWAPWLTAQRFPSLEIHAVHAWIAGGGNPPAGVARVLLYPATWIGVGWIALRIRFEPPPRLLTLLRPGRSRTPAVTSPPAAPPRNGPSP